MSGYKILAILIGLAVGFFQLILTQVVTFIFSFLLPNAQTFGENQPFLFAIFLGVTFTIGVFFAGWLAIRLGWLKTKPKYPARLVCTFLGAFLPLIAALLIYQKLEAGNPFFAVATFACIFGFHLPGWLDRAS